MFNDYELLRTFAKLIITELNIGQLWYQVEFSHWTFLIAERKKINNKEEIIIYDVLKHIKDMIKEKEINL